ncbi:MAG: cytochrome c [Pelagimonas sp.]|jgi:hypothetical protein|nr:cytochrome c [Pelagimonas sp.]
MKRALMIVMLLWPGLLLAEDRQVRLYVAQPVIDSGLMKHILPRFSLKNQVKVTLVERDAAHLSIADTGAALFDGLGQTWRIDPVQPSHAGAKKLVKYLRSEVGQRTVFGFAPEGVVLFGEASVAEDIAEDTAPAQDVVAGLRASKQLCARCHSVEGLGGGIGSTPSFSVLRSLEDWETRFATFFQLKPHPAFTQIPDVTDPFPIDRPSPIAPVEMDMEELDAILTYVGAMGAADLGNPLKHQ